MKRHTIFIGVLAAVFFAEAKAQTGNFTTVNTDWLNIRAGRDDHSGWGYGYDNTADQRPNATDRPVFFMNHHFGITLSAHSFYGGIRFYNQAWPGATYDPATGAKMVMSLVNGNVGVNTTDPDEKLVVYGGNLKIFSGGAEGARLIWRGGVNGLQEYRTRVGTDGNLDFFTTEGNHSTLTLTQDRNVGIGTMDPKGYKLAVAGNMIAEKIKVKAYANWPDYVFDSSYILPSLKDVESFILKNKHLPGIPSAGSMRENGIDLADNQAALLQKIEELTLYLIDQEKEKTEQKNRIDKQEKEIDQLKKQLNEVIEMQSRLVGAGR
ncbi:DUF3450 domain-containing protein [Terrimonas sp. NA20]|uniref:DUF3450 domain-containing protein n=1 Tax=Terrimonas ginsenosidimutans TaxID=2908004 RepID=A0ABS9KZL2_9BACT|nr:DUF3450 domain-containing protein [Terrimonas ginsenosidimutans]MCG2617753.1 DUF3450 domain-containing protein [Terrimonas ginsenosidimutans]